MQPYPDDATYTDVTNFLQKYIYALYQDMEIAEEVTQRTLLRGVEQWDRFNGTTRGEFFAWHKAIAWYRLLNYRQHERLVQNRRALLTNPVTGEENPSVPVDESVDEQAQYLDLEEGLLRLPQWQRNALILTGMGYTAKEQASMEGIIEQTVASRVFKGRRELRRIRDGQAGTQGPSIYEGGTGD